MITIPIFQAFLIEIKQNNFLPNLKAQDILLDALNHRFLLRLIPLLFFNIL